MSLHVVCDPMQTNPAVPLPSVVSTLRTSWRVGSALCKPGTGARRKPPDWYRDPSVNFSPQEKAVFKQCTFYVEKARQSAAQEDIATSCQLFAVARVVSNSPSLSREVKLLCQSELEAAEAYLDYVCGAAEAAKDRLLLAMKADEALEREYGHTDLHTHRVHLANNVVKVEARAGRLSESLALASCILHYIDDEVSTLPLPGGWGKAYRSFLTSAPCEFLARQSALEVACATADPETEGMAGAWNAFYKSLGPAASGSARGGEVEEWCAVKDAFLQTRSDASDATLDRYGAIAARYLEHGPRESTSLWKLVGLDVAFVCANFDTVGALPLRAEITEELTRATSLPRHVRKLIDQLKRISAQEPVLKELAMESPPQRTSAA